MASGNSRRHGTIEIRKYLDDSGSCPYDKRLAGIRDSRARGRIETRLTKLKEGLTGDAKSLGEGVHELRIDYGPGYRVYFGRAGESLVILLVTGDKRTQSADILLSKKYWLDYRTREESDD